MGYVIVFSFEFLIVLLIGISWAKGAEWMKENHPNYNGEDFLGEYNENGKKP